MAPHRSRTPAARRLSITPLSADQEGRIAACRAEAEALDGEMQIDRLGFLDGRVRFFRPRQSLRSLYPATDHPH
jgi:hypothetical protein